MLIAIKLAIPSGNYCDGCDYQQMGNDKCLLFRHNKIRHMPEGKYEKCTACENACKEAANV